MAVVLDRSFEFGGFRPQATDDDFIIMEDVSISSSKSSSVVIPEIAKNGEEDQRDRSKMLGSTADLPLFVTISDDCDSSESHDQILDDDSSNKKEEEEKNAAATLIQSTFLTHRTRRRRISWMAAAAAATRNSAAKAAREAGAAAAAAAQSPRRKVNRSQRRRGSLLDFVRPAPVAEEQPDYGDGEATTSPKRRVNQSQQRRGSLLDWVRVGGSEEPAPQPDYGYEDHAPKDYGYEPHSPDQQPQDHDSPKPKQRANKSQQRRGSLLDWVRGGSPLDQSATNESTTQPSIYSYDSSSREQLGCVVSADEPKPHRRGSLLAWAMTPASPRSQQRSSKIRKEQVQRRGSLLQWAFGGGPDAADEEERKREQHLYSNSYWPDRSELSRQQIRRGSLASVNMDSDSAILLDGSLGGNSTVTPDQQDHEDDGFGAGLLDMVNELWRGGAQLLHLNTDDDDNNTRHSWTSPPGTARLPDDDRRRHSFDPDRRGSGRRRSSHHQRQPMRRSSGKSLKKTANWDSSAYWLNENKSKKKHESPLCSALNRSKRNLNLHSVDDHQAIQEWSPCEYPFAELIRQIAALPVQETVEDFASFWGFSALAFGLADEQLFRC